MSKPASRPIIFSGPMVRALLEGRKTQTRRLLKPQLVCTSHADWPDEPDPKPIIDADGMHCGICGAGVQLDYRRKSGVRGIPIPYAVGDLLWVREAWQVRGLAWGLKPRDTRVAARSAFHHRATDDGAWRPEWGGWRPSIHMPRWASRLTLQVTGVKVERLREIAEADAKAEGARPAFTRTTVPDWPVSSRPSYVWGFEEVWDSINGKRPGAGWEDNPWVAAVTFTVHQANVGELVEHREVA